MRILYISSVCAQGRFDRLVNLGAINCQFQNQKFHHLVLSGLRACSDATIDVVSFYPVNRNIGFKMKHDDEEENGVHYVYPGYINLPIFHHIIKLWKTFFFLKRYRKADSIIICNIMNYDECLAALLFRLFYKIRVCAITADVPGITSGAVSVKSPKWKYILHSMVDPLYKSMNNKYDAYLFLSEAMNNVVNTRNKPFIVVEGMSDLVMKDIRNSISQKYHKRTIMYVGGIHREYGIDLLVEAFHMLNNADVELHIYGKGNYEKELEKISEIDSRIKYFGTRPNYEVINKQIKAHILVNPRPTGADFVKYSFPSKIIEYMASGTPVLTTRIPSMPRDYYPFVYFFDIETKEGFFNSLTSILGLSDEELHNKGMAAKSFILSEKNYMIQAGKLFSFLQKLSS